MKVQAFWWGGCSWAHSVEPEEFASIKDAETEFTHRRKGGDLFYPCVGDESVMDCYPTDPDASYGSAFLRLSVGPRGGVRKEWS